MRDYGDETITIWDAKDGCEHRWNSIQIPASGGIGEYEVGRIGNAIARSDSHKPRNSNVCSKCGAWRGQLGLEPTPELYISHLVQIFEEVRRIIKKDGTLWLNLGDTFFGSGCGTNDYRTDSAKGLSGKGKNAEKYKDSRPQNNRNHEYLKAKDLAMIPARTAIELQRAGWWLRSEIVWHKPNPMPESVTDRPTKSHEMIYLFSKNADYYYDAEAIAEPIEKTNLQRYEHAVRTNEQYNPTRHKNDGKHQSPMEVLTRAAKNVLEGGKRNKRSVWTIPTQNYDGAHFAVFPTEIPRLCITAGTSEKGECPKCGKAWKRKIESKWKKQEQSPKTMAQDVKGNPMYRGGHHNDGLPYQGEKKTLGWQPQCSCGEDSIPQVVLDPFCGSGTTGEMALRLGRRFIGIEISEKYVRELAEPRCNNVNPLFGDAVAVL